MADSQSGSDRPKFANQIRVKLTEPFETTRDFASGWQIGFD
jgi:hypothetical protein